jgi:hypothetical protein
MTIVLVDWHLDLLRPPITAVTQTIEKLAEEQLPVHGASPTVKYTYLAA